MEYIFLFQYFGLLTFQSEIDSKGDRGTIFQRVRFHKRGKSEWTYGRIYCYDHSEKSLRIRLNETGEPYIVHLNHNSDMQFNDKNPIFDDDHDLMSSSIDLPIPSHDWSPPHFATIPSTRVSHLRFFCCSNVYGHFTMSLC